MSFGKSKTVRFQEMKSYAPPVGTYDPRSPVSNNNFLKFNTSERFKELGIGLFTEPKKRALPNQYNTELKPLKMAKLNVLATPHSNVNVENIDPDS